MGIPHSLVSILHSPIFILHSTFSIYSFFVLQSLSSILHSPLNMPYSILAGVLRIECDVGNTSTTLANYRFKPIFWPLKLKIIILNNLVNTTRIEEKTGTNHAK